MTKKAPYALYDMSYVLTLIISTSMFWVPELDLTNLCTGSSHTITVEDEHHPSKPLRRYSF